MSKKNRRELLVEAGRFALAGAIAPYCRQALQVRPKRLPSSHDTKADEEQTEAAAKIIDALEGAYEYSGPAPEPHQGRRCHWVSSLEVRSLHLFALRAFFRAQATGGDRALLPWRAEIPRLSDAEKSPRGMALQFRMPDGGLHHMTMIHTRCSLPRCRRFPR